MSEQIVIVVSEKALSVINNIKKAIEKSITGVSFVSIRNYTNQQGETSNSLINVGINYENAKKKDIEFLENLKATEYEFKSTPDLIEEARQALINGFMFPEENRSNGQKNAYTTIFNGVKVHNETGFIYIFGYREQKTILKQGEYKQVNSRPLTIAKNELKKLLKTGKFTQFALEEGNEIRCNGATLEL
jgi:hypothetical protein